MKNKIITIIIISTVLATFPNVFAQIGVVVAITIHDNNSIPNSLTYSLSSDFIKA